jgi:hypothetical protein
MKFKYIIIDGLYPILFPEAVSHNQISPNSNIKSAGYVQFIIEDSKVIAKTYGESKTLKIGPKKTDAILIESIYRTLFTK